MTLMTLRVIQGHRVIRVKIIDYQKGTVYCHMFCIPSRFYGHFFPSEPTID